jgi:hypothetical protein
VEADKLKDILRQARAKPVKLKPRCGCSWWHNLLETDIPRGFVSGPEGAARPAPLC